MTTDDKIVLLARVVLLLRKKVETGSLSRMDDAVLDSFRMDLENIAARGRL
jgi:hypothetical protein